MWPRICQLANVVLNNRDRNTWAFTGASSYAAFHFGGYHIPAGCVNLSLFVRPHPESLCPEEKRKRDGKDRHTSGPYSGSLESLCAVRRDSVRRTEPTWPVDEKYLILLDQLVHLLDKFEQPEYFMNCIFTWLWQDLAVKFKIQIIVNHGKNREKIDFSSLLYMRYI